ncbi:MAG: serine/threonine protein kinase [Alphaproteobacteria bacterium]|nr:serine/threonine protein kinase [Alphaproteobacteria bacterium]
MTDARHDAGVPRGRRFILQRRIGAGAFGEVFLAEQDSGAGFRRRVALKVLHADVARSKGASKRMRDEARILGRLSHRNIVGVLDLVRLGDRWAVVMEYVPGADLEQVSAALKETGERFSPAAAMGVLAALGRALDAAWHTDDGQGGQLRVVHRDIKPSNVRLTPDGEVKVLDFGVARVELDEREAATKAGALIGTERYMSPEVLLRQPSGPGSDVYAAGATVTELLLGEALGITPVFSDRHTEFLDERLEGVAANLAGLPDAQRDAVVTLLKDCLAAEVADRPSAIDMADRATALARHLDGDDLETFARHAVLTVLRIKGPEGDHAEGSLTERNTSGPATSQGSNPALQTFMGTLMPGEQDEPDPAFSSMSHASLVDETGGASPRPEASRSAPTLLLAGAAVLALSSAVLAWVLMGNGATPAPAAPTPATVAPVLPVPAPPEPLPTAAPVTAPDATATPADAAPSDDGAEAPSVAPPAAIAPAPAEPKASPKVDAKADSKAPSKAAPEPKASAEPKAADAAPAAYEGPRVSRAQVSVANASSVVVTCGDRTASGTASVRLKDFPPGPCTVKAVWEGRTLSTTVAVDRPTGLQCEATAGGLSCHP